MDLNIGSGQLPSALKPSLAAARATRSDQRFEDLLSTDPAPQTPAAGLAAAKVGDGLGRFSKLLPVRTSKPDQPATPTPPGQTSKLLPPRTPMEALRKQLLAAAGGVRQDVAADGKDVPAETDDAGKEDDTGAAASAAFVPAPLWATVPVPVQAPAAPAATAAAPASTVPAAAVGPQGSTGLPSSLTADAAAQEPGAAAGTSVQPQPAATAPVAAEPNSSPGAAAAISDAALVQVAAPADAAAAPQGIQTTAAGLDPAVASSAVQSVPVAGLEPVAPAPLQVDAAAADQGVAGGKAAGVAAGVVTARAGVIGSRTGSRAAATGLSSLTSGKALAAAAKGGDAAAPDPDAGLSSGALAAQGTAAPTAPAPDASADASEPVLDTRDPSWMSALLEHAAEARDAGGRTMRIALTPDALGKVEVSVRRVGDQLHVSLDAATPAAQALLADARPTLLAMADARGLSLADATIGTGTGGSQNGGARRQDDAAQPLANPAPGASDESTASILSAAPERLA